VLVEPGAEGGAYFCGLDAFVDEREVLAGGEGGFGVCWGMVSVG